MLHAHDGTIRPVRSALLAGALGLALSALLAGPTFAGVDSGVNAGKPLDGTVGNADDKAPPGQVLDGTDRNAGYECDANQGVGKGNPAHTGCGDPGDPGDPVDPKDPKDPKEDDPGPVPE